MKCNYNVTPTTTTTVTVPLNAATQIGSKLYNGHEEQLRSFQQTIKSSMYNNKHNRDCVPLLTRAPVVLSADGANQEAVTKEAALNVALFYLLLPFLTEATKLAISLPPLEDDGHSAYNALIAMARGTKDYNAIAVLERLMSFNATAATNAAEVITATNMFNNDAAMFASLDGVPLSPRVLCYLYSHHITISDREEGFVNQLQSDMRSDATRATAAYWQTSYLAARQARDARDAAAHAAGSSVNANTITRGTGQARPIHCCPHCKSVKHFTLAHCPESDKKLECTTCSKLGHEAAACYQGNPHLRPGNRGARAPTADKGNAAAATADRDKRCATSDTASNAGSAFNVLANSAPHAMHDPGPVANFSSFESTYDTFIGSSWSPRGPAATAARV